MCVPSFSFIPFDVCHKKQISWGQGQLSAFLRPVFTSAAFHLVLTLPHFVLRQFQVSLTIMIFFKLSYVQRPLPEVLKMRIKYKFVSKNTQLKVFLLILVSVLERGKKNWPIIWSDHQTTMVWSLEYRFVKQNTNSSVYRYDEIVHLPKTVFLETCFHYVVSVWGYSQ